MVRHAPNRRGEKCASKWGIPGGMPCCCQMAPLRAWYLLMEICRADATLYRAKAAGVTGWKSSRGVPKKDWSRESIEKFERIGKNKGAIGPFVFHAHCLFHSFQLDSRRLDDLAQQCAVSPDVFGEFLG